jgi:Ubiquitin carboxyl-terminal hydrolase
VRHDARPLTLARCMDTFTAQESIPEGYCSRCKALRETRMQLALWRLPPVLVIQLKRFQYTAYSRRKLRNLVQFPIRGLDLSPFVAQSEQQQQQQQQQQSARGTGRRNSVVQQEAVEVSGTGHDEAVATVSAICTFELLSSMLCVHGCHCSASQRTFNVTSACICHCCHCLCYVTMFATVCFKQCEFVCRHSCMAYR